MRIIEIIPELIHGGAERFVVDMCNQLAQDHEVYLLVMYPIDREQPIVGEIDEHIKVISANKKTGFDISSIIRVNKIISYIKPDVVHTHLYALPYLLPSFMTKKRILFLHTIHSHASLETEKGIKTWLRKYAFSHHKVYPITISEESQLSFFDFYGLDSKLIYNGRPSIIMDESELQKAKNEIKEKKVDINSQTFINVARIVDVKNQLALAEAIDWLTKNGWNVELFIIGYAQDKTIEEKILSLNNDRIHLLGLKKEPRNYMKYADAFVLSSTTEGMPITLIEAFSVGLIPICTAVGGVKNMIKDGENGLLIKSPHKDDIIDTLKRFISLSKEEKSKMATMSKQSYEQYDMARCADNYLSYINELTKK